MVGEPDEEVVANSHKLDLNEDETFVLYGAQPKTWSMNRDQKREERKGRQLADASRWPTKPPVPNESRKFRLRDSWRFRKCAKCARTSESRVSQAIAGQVPGTAILHTSCPEGASGCQQSRPCSQQTMVTTFFTLPVCNALINTGAGQDLETE